MRSKGTKGVVARVSGEPVLEETEEEGEISWERIATEWEIHTVGQQQGRIYSDLE